ncbi:MAG: hypothetical protein JW822_10430 [Spirochaetales bacterium]|nr:hypothetical protein [Spirochaetales bacterium]
MKRLFLLLLIFFFIVPLAFAYKILYAEQFYKLFHLHFYQYPDDTMENISYLEQALKADFCNPLYALAKIETEIEYERYKSLFKMHINLKMIEQYLILGSKYDKFEVFFFHKNGPWKEDICQSLKTAEQAYRVALYYWEQAQKWSKKAWPLRMIHLDEIQHWSDENFRIETQDLDYKKIIQKHLARINKSRVYLECAPDSTD